MTEPPFHGGLQAQTAGSHVGPIGRHSYARCIFPACTPLALGHQWLCVVRAAASPKRHGGCSMRAGGRPHRRSMHAHGGRIDAACMCTRAAHQSLEGKGSSCMAKAKAVWQRRQGKGGNEARAAMRQRLRNRAAKYIKAVNKGEGGDTAAASQPLAAAGKVATRTCAIRSAHG